MVDRVTTVKLALDMQGFRAALATCKSDVRDFSKLVQTNASAQKESWNTAGRDVAKFAALSGLAFGIVVKKAADFDQAMSNVQAALQVTPALLNDLRQAALVAGAKTVFSAEEAANAIEEMGKAGVSTTDILSGGLDAALSLASAGGLGVADAANIAATALVQFNLKGTDMAHVSDLLAAGAGKAMGDVSDLAQALKYVGPVASSMGISIDETVGTLAELASQGILADQAGTSLRGMLSSLTSPSKIAKNEMKDLGITLYDQQGKFLGLQNVAGQLETAYKGMTDQQRDASLGVIFGNDQVTAARVIYGEGAKGIADWTAKVNDSGYAAKVAADRLDNLNGDVENLKGALDTAFIQSGSGANDMLRMLTQGATQAVNVYDELPQSVQSGIGIFTGLAAIVGVTNAAFLLGVPRVVAYREALDKMGPVTRAAAGGLKLVGGTLGVVAAGFGAAEGINMLLSKLSATDAEMQNIIATGQTADQIITKAFQGQADYNGTWDNGAATLADYQGQLQHLKDVQDNWFARFVPENTSAMGSLGVVLNTVGKQLSTMADSNLPAAQKAFQELSEKVGGNRDLMLAQLNAMPEFKSKLTELATTAGLAADDQTLLSLAMGELETKTSSASSATSSFTPVLGTAAAAAGEAGDDVASLAQAIKDYNSAIVDAENGSIGLEQAIDDTASRVKDIQKGTKGYAATLKIGTQAGRDNMKALLDLADAANTAASQQFTLTGSVDGSNAKLQEGRTAFIKAADAMGISRKAAEKLADKYIAIPTEVKTQVELSGVDDAKKKLADFMQSAKLATNSPIPVPIQSYSAPYVLKTDAKKSHKATGGAITGPGTSTSDSIPIMASTGEHMLDAGDVQAMGGQGAVYAFRASLHRFANGGATDATLEQRLKDARHAEKVAQDAYDAISSSEKNRSAKLAAKEKLAAASKATDKAEKAWDARKTANAGYTDYLKDRRSQNADGRYDSAMAAQMPNSPAGKQLAQQYRDEAASAALQAATDNIASLRKVIADPNASKAIREKARQKLKAEQSKLYDAQIAQIATDLKGQVQDAWDQARDEIAGGLKQLNLGDLSSSTTQWSRYVNADGSVSMVSSSGAGAITKASVLGSLDTQSAETKQFAADLKALSGKIPGSLLEYIGSQGVTNGDALAKAFLSMNASELKRASASYTAIGAYADQAGATGANAQYGQQLTDLQRAIAGGTDAIVKELQKGIKVRTNANGGMYAYANGGITPGMYSGARGPLYKFAEPETGWEAFISGKPGQEARNRRILSQAAARLGMYAYADGGFNSYGRPRAGAVPASTYITQRITNVDRSDNRQYHSTHNWKDNASPAQVKNRERIMAAEL